MSLSVSDRIYLDYNASAPLVAPARAAMVAALDLTGNPSSVHAEGRQLRGLIETAREHVAALVGARVADVVFTSGATEANATALGRGWDAALRAGVEHDCVLAPLSASGARLIELPVSRDGVVQVDAIADAILRGGEPLGRAVIALQWANNETGVVQPVAEVAQFARSHGVAVHCDAVQGVGRMPVDFAALGLDTMALSAHKLGGPKGIGALVIREGTNVQALLRGGGQERRRRAGTEDVLAIVGFGAAAKVASEGLARRHEIDLLRTRLEVGMLQACPDAVVFGAAVERLDNTTCISSGRSAEILVIKLDMAGFAVSAGSACSSGKVAASHVLAAMGIDPELARGAIRISLGASTTGADVDAFLRAWREVHSSNTHSVEGQTRGRHTTRHNRGDEGFAPSLASGE
jgi:cysteine desulfurase